MGNRPDRQWQRHQYRRTAPDQRLEQHLQPERGLGFAAMHGGCKFEPPDTDNGESDEERNDQQVFDKIFVGNIKGAKLEEVMDFVENLSEDDRLLAREVVAFANR